jgi:hypothetical protein
VAIAIVIGIIAYAMHHSADNPNAGAASAVSENVTSTGNTGTSAGGGASGTTTDTTPNSMMGNTNNATGNVPGATNR